MHRTRRPCSLFASVLICMLLMVTGPAAYAYLYDTFGAGPGWPNRVDDRIDAMNPGELVDIIVDFCSTPTGADSTYLAGYGMVYGVFGFIDAIAVRGVLVSDCYNIVMYPRVKLIEWDQILQPNLDISACAIQARASTYYPYPSQAVWDLNPPQGYLGSGINIAVIDTGVDDGHPALAGKFIAGYDGLAGVGGPGVNPDDDMVGWFHGTAVAGMIMGNDPAQQYMGVAPNAGLIDCKIFDPQGNSPASRMIATIQWVMQNAATYNIAIANMSFGGFPDDGTDAVARAANALAQSGVVVVASAGNYPPSNGISSPGSGDDVICVGGVNDMATIPRADDTYDPVARVGPRTPPPPAFMISFNDLKPEVSAYIRDITTCLGSNPGQGGAGFWQHPGVGTSWATAHTSGVVALLLEKYPGLTPAQADNLLRMNAEARGPATYPSIDPIWNYQYGWGIVSAAATVNAVLPVDVSVTAWIPGVWNSHSIWAGHYPVTVNDPNTLNARVFARGGPASGVVVTFDVMQTGWGSPWSPVGATTVNIPWGGSTVASINYTPPPGMEGHRCFRVTATYATDTNPANNSAQENIDIQPGRTAGASAGFRKIERPPALAADSPGGQREIDVQTVPAADAISRRSEDGRYAFPIRMCVEPSAPVPFRTADACICLRDLPPGSQAWLDPEPPFDLFPGECRDCLLFVEPPAGQEFSPSDVVHVNGWFWGNGIAEGGVSVYFGSPPPIETTIAEVQYTDDPVGDSPLLDQAVTVSGIATTEDETYPDRFAMQEGQGPWTGLFVRSNTGDEVLRGDELRITGTVVETDGLTELDLISNFEVVSTGNPVPAPEILDPAVVDTHEEYEGVLVQVRDVVVVETGPDDWAVESNGICRVGRWGLYGYVPALGDGLHVTGVSGALAMMHRLQPRDDEDIEELSSGLEEGLPAVLSLRQNHPNPFRSVTAIAYTLPANDDVVLRIYDVSGRLVRTLVNGPQPAGYRLAAWDGRTNAGAPAPSGIYFCSLRAGGREITGQMVRVE